MERELMRTYWRSQHGSGWPVAASSRTLTVGGGGGGAPVRDGGGDQAEEGQGDKKRVLVGLDWFMM